MDPGIHMVRFQQSNRSFETGPSGLNGSMALSRQCAGLGPMRDFRGLDDSSNGCGMVVFQEILQPSYVDWMAGMVQNGDEEPELAVADKPSIAAVVWSDCFHSDRQAVLHCVSGTWPCECETRAREETKWVMPPFSMRPERGMRIAAGQT